jgi:hypothetical protein
MPDRTVGYNPGLNLLFTALQMLCALGATILAATVATRWDLSAMAVGFAASMWFAVTGQIPDAALTGVAVALVAALKIFRPKIPFLAPMCAGALAGVWAAIIQTQGAPVSVALTITGMVAAVSALCTAKLPAFAPENLREEALLVTVALGLATAMLPEMSAGWQSALVLNREQQASSNYIIANWVLMLSAASVALGGLYSLLRRR